MADKIAKRGVSIYIDGKEVANSVKAISGEMRKLTNEQAKMTIGSDEYIAHAKKIEYLKSLHREHLENQKKISAEYGNMSKSAESGLSKMANGFNKYFAIFTAGLAAVTGLTLGLKKFIDMRNELEQSSASLKAITGLDDKSVAWMRQYAKELSTTTTEAGVRITATSKEIMDGFTVIGSKRPELLKNKEAMADVTKQALTLAATGVPVETAFEVVTASMNQFNLTGKDANRIINSIAAGSLEGSAEADSLAGSLKNVGTVANDSNMSLEDTVAMLEVLASKQLVGEEAGTKLRGALLKLKDAGVGYASGQFNVRDAIIEVNQQMAKKANALQRDALLQKIFGAENITAGTILLQNVDAYDKLRVAVNGTDVAMRQAKIQTSTISAQIEQAKNRFNEAGMSLVKNLNPAMLKAISFTTLFVKGFADIVGETKSATSQFDDQSKKVLNLKMNLEPLLRRYDELAGKTNKSVSENAELKRIITEVTSVMPGAVTAVDKYGNAIAISTGRVRQFIDAEVARLGVVNKSAIEENRKALSQVEKDIARSKQNIDEINKTGTLKITTQQITGTGAVINNTGNASSEEIQAEQDKYRQLIQDKLGYQSEIDRLNGATLKKQISDAKKAQEEQAKLDAKSVEDSKTNASKNTGTGTSSPDKATVQKKKIDDAIQQLENDNLKKLAAIKQQYIDGDIKTEYDYNQQLLDQQDNYDSLRKKKLQELLKVITDPGLKLDLNKQIAEIDKKALDRQIEQNNKIKKILLDADPIKSENQSYANRLRELGLFGVAKEKMTADQLETLRILEEQHNEAMRKLSTKQAVVELKNLDKEQQDAEKMLADERLTTQMSEQIYKDKMIALELSFMRRKLAIQGLSADEIDKITKQLNQKLIDSSEASAQQLLSFKDHYGLDELSRFKLQKETELKILQDYINKGLLSEKDAVKVRKILASDEILAKTKDFREQASAISDVSDVFSNALQGFQSAEEKSIETKYQKQIDAAKKAGKDTTKIEEEKNQKLAEVRAKNADAEFLLQVAQITSMTAVSAINAYASALKVPGIGLILAPIAAGAAIAYGASQIAVAESAREAAKSGYYDGGYHKPEGYTGGTDPREVRGVFPDGQPYHGDEFIANHKTTRNREVRPVLDLIDSAQKLGTASSLTKSDISKALRLSPGYSDGGYRGSNTPVSPNYNDGGDTMSMAEIAAAINRLNDRLDKGIVAESVISGRTGSFEQTKKYEKLIKNASR